MNDIIELIWIHEYVSGVKAKYYTLFEVDYLANDVSDYINGFRSIASDPLPKEVEHLRMDTDNSATGQYDNRLLYYTPIHSNWISDSSVDFSDPEGVPNIYQNNDPVGDQSPKKFRRALQVLANDFSGYIIPLDKVEASLDTDPAEKPEVRLHMFRQYRKTDSGYTLRSEYEFTNTECIWKYTVEGILQLVSTTNAMNSYANALVALDKYSGLIPNKAFNEASISTVKSFHEFLNDIIDVTTDSQIIQGRVTGKFNQTIFSSDLTYAGRNLRLGMYDYKDF